MPDCSQSKYCVLKSLNVRRKTRVVFLCLYYRAEALSEPLTKPSCKIKATNTKPKPPPTRAHFPLGTNPFLERPQPFISPQSCDAQGQRYTAEEIEVLR